MAVGQFREPIRLLVVPEVSQTIFSRLSTLEIMPYVRFVFNGTTMKRMVQMNSFKQIRKKCIGGHVLSLEWRVARKLRGNPT